MAQPKDKTMSSLVSDVDKVLPVFIVRPLHTIRQDSKISSRVRSEKIVCAFTRTYHLHRYKLVHICVDGLELEKYHPRGRDAALSYFFCEAFSGAASVEGLSASVKDPTEKLIWTLPQIIRGSSH